MAGAGAILAATTLAAMVPIALTALGEIIAERSGVVNIGLEGILLFSAWAGAFVALASGSWAAGYLAGLLVGVALGALHALIAVYLRGDQIIAGVGVNILAAGATSVLTYAAWGNYSNSPVIEASIPGIVVGNVRVSFMAPLTIVLGVLVWYLLDRTRIGLIVRAVGDDPASAETLGVSVERVRAAATILGAAMAGVAGAYMSVDYLGQFVKLMSQGRGFIALADVAFSGWNPLGALLGAIVFGASDAVATYYSSTLGASAETYIYKTLPYVVTLLAVAATARRARMPRALGRPYRRE